MSKRTVPIMKVCPVCKNEFPACPPGKSSRLYPPNNQIFCSHRCAYDGRYRRGSQCKTLTPTEAAYIAGFLDADGSIFLYKRDRKARLRVSFANCKQEVLDWIFSKTGVGNKVEKPIHSQRHRPAYLLFINSDAAASLLKQVVEYLIIKRAQADLSLWFQDRMRDPEFSSQIEWQQKAKDQMQELNRRGNI